ncbi:S8 family serine peptidase [Algoriphagus algorifonticola]|uniref:S8 family serine peptidase n=1 Tax=Algoriphagus algorifonticola TaxID=2593007 RepID=UPI0011A26133|nr:S8 family serine peptidase [Algoriphagus algorifonticola]
MKYYNYLKYLLSILLFSCELNNVNEIDIQTPIEKVYWEPIPNQYIVTLGQSFINFKLDGDYISRQKLFRTKTKEYFEKYGLREESILHVYESAIYGFTFNGDINMMEQIKSDPLVQNVEQDFEIKLLPILRPILDPLIGGNNPNPSPQPAQSIPYGIIRVNGGVSYNGGKSVFVVDTGIQLNHPDLNVDSSKGFNAFSTGSNGASLNDGNGHGTHVAGTIGALDNEIGVIGVAPGVKVVPVKVLGSNGSGTNSGVIAGVNYIASVGQNGDVANLSLGGGVSIALDNAVLNASNKGIWFVLAAGNSSTNSSSSSPGRVNGPFILTVSAMDRNDRFASFSNFGNPPIDWCAPGVSINSTWINSTYRSISGTSMAAPHVAGLLVLGEIESDGFVIGDPDNNPDPIASRR